MCIVCLSSFDAIGFGNTMTRGGVGRTAAEAGAQAGDDPMPTGARRNSFLYRSTDSLTDISPMSMSRKVSATSGEVSVFSQFLDTWHTCLDVVVVVVIPSGAQARIYLVYVNRGPAATIAYIYI